MVKTTVLGGGKQGTTGVEKLVESIWMPDSENIESGLSSRHNIETTTVVEEDKDRAEGLEEQFNDNELVEVVNQTAEEYLEQNSVEGLVYDATDTNQRLNTVTEAVLENTKNPENLAYWSEKPASEKIQDIADAGSAASMDLIENFSLQKKSVIADLKEENYEVESISTWRTSKTDKQVQLNDDGSINLERSRNLFQENAGSAKDKGAHDWGNILLTLEATDQDEEIEIDGENSEYRVVEVEKGGEKVAYTESGEEVELPYDGEERLNDGYADTRGGADDVDLRVVTSLADWPENIDEDMEQLYERFREGIEEELGDVDLVYGEEDNEEIRVEHLEAEDPETGEKAEYLVSTGADMLTLKRTETVDGEENYELLAEGGTDFLASYLEEGLHALENEDYDQTVSVESAVRTGEVIDRAAEKGYHNSGEPITVEAPEGSNLRTVLRS